MAGSLLADLSRMGSDNAFTDLVLTAQGGYQREANCVVLAARSRVFKKMLSSEMQEGQLDDSAKRHRHVDLPEVSAEVLDHLLEWCYCDTLRDLDLAGTVDLLRAADCFEITALLQKCCQRVGKILTPELLPEAIRLAEAISSAELLHSLASFAAKADVDCDMPCELRTLVLQEKKKILERNINELRLRLANVPAPRPAIVFWRQSLPEELHKDLVQEALQSPEAVPALLAGFREKAPVLFREACAKRWKELDAATKEAFDASAFEDQAKFQESKWRLEQQLHDLGNELKALEGAMGYPRSPGARLQVALVLGSFTLQGVAVNRWTLGICAVMDSFRRRADSFHKLRKNASGKGSKGQSSRWQRSSATCFGENRTKLSTVADQ